MENQPELPAERCGNCKFAIMVSADRSACRRNPPVVMYMPFPQQNVAGGQVSVDWSRTATTFPLVNPDKGWCGEWQQVLPTLSIQH